MTCYSILCWSVIRFFASFQKVSTSDDSVFFDFDVGLRSERGVRVSTPCTPPASPGIARSRCLHNVHLTSTLNMIMVRSPAEQALNSASIHQVRLQQSARCQLLLVHFIFSLQSCKCCNQSIKYPGLTVPGVDPRPGWKRGGVNQ